MINEHSHDRHDHNQNRSFDFFRNVNIQFLIHEIKGPLNVIETNISLLLDYQKDYGKLSASQQKILQRSMRSAVRIRNIIYTLLEVGRSEAGHVNLQRFDVVQCATEVIKDAIETITLKQIDVSEDALDLTKYLEDNGMCLIVSPEIENVCLYQDKTKFMFILGNLIRNGLHHKKSTVTVQCMLKEGHLLISISDDGPGVTPENRDDLFRCYANSKTQHTRNRGKGHSLGLASSRILARYLGGDIVLNDQFPGGAQFTLQLPLEFDAQGAEKKRFDVCDSES